MGFGPDREAVWSEPRLFQQYGKVPLAAQLMGPKAKALCNLRDVWIGPLGTGRIEPGSIGRQRRKFRVPGQKPGDHTLVLSGAKVQVE